MNTSYKVVFNRARRALMVVNEITSSVQAKGTKTVLATALTALVAGSSIAAETAWVEAPQQATDSQQVTTITNGPSAFRSFNQNTSLDGDLWVFAKTVKGDAAGYAIDGLDKTLTHKGNLYISADSDAKSWKQEGLFADNQSTAINEGKIVAKKAYAMRVGTKKAAHLINNGEVFVEVEGAGIELGGASGADAINNGTITLQNITGEFGIGVLIKGTSGVTFTNNGTITTDGDKEKVAAISVQAEKNKATSATLILGPKSQINGSISLGADTTTHLQLDGTQGELTVAAHGRTDMTLKNGAKVTLADGQESNYENVNIESGTLTASIFHTESRGSVDNHFKAVTIGQDGTFNIKALNSKDNTQFLLNDLQLTLDGGHLQVGGSDYQGDLKIGSSLIASSLTINQGDYRFNKIAFGSSNKANNKSSLTLNKGSLTVQTLDFTTGDIAIEGGVLTTQKLIWDVPKDTVWKKAGEMTIAENGTLTLNARNDLLTDTGEQTEAAKHITNKGTIVLTDQFEASAADVKTFIEKLGLGDKILFKNMTLSDSEVAWNPNLGTATSNATVTAPEADEEGHASVDLAGQTVGVAGLKVSDSTKTLAIEGSGELVMTGNTTRDTLFAGKDELESVKITNLTLGADETSTGILNTKVLTTGKLTLNNGAFDAKDVQVNTATISGQLDVTSLRADDRAIFQNGVLTLKGRAEDNAHDIAGKVYVTGNGVITTNKAAAAKILAKRSDIESGSLLYVDRPVKLAEGSVLTIGGKAPVMRTPRLRLMRLATAAPSPASVNVAEGGLAVVDTAAFGDSDTVYEGAHLNVSEGEMLLTNVKTVRTMKLASSITGENISTDNAFIGANVDGGNVDLAYNEGAVADKTVDNRLKARYSAGLSDKEAFLLDSLDAPAYLEGDRLNAKGNAALEQITSGNATTGVLNVAYDANQQVSDAIVRHQLSEHNGKGLWADVFYAKNEAKEIYGHSGYSADIYGGVIGVDGTFSCGATGGIALTVGTADADSKGGVFSTSLDSDFWGVSAYAVKPMGDFHVKADLGYLHFDNDLTGLGDASDASTVTVGLRADYTAFQKGAFSITPHAGIRYTHIDTDAVAFNDDQKMNIVETPVGVTFAGNFETTGWTIVPSYDFTIVPQLADKEVEAFGSADDMKILNGGLYNNVLGVQAQKGNVSFGLHAAYGFGSNERSNTQVNANVRYNF